MVPDAHANIPMNQLQMMMGCTSNRGPGEACRELGTCTCVCSAVYSRFALSLMENTDIPTAMSVVYTDCLESQSFTAYMFGWASPSEA